jgi:hypothetical protein
MISTSKKATGQPFYVLAVSSAICSGVCGGGIASLTRQSSYQCVADSTADGVFGGMRDKRAQTSLMRLAIEKVISSDMYFGRL